MAELEEKIFFEQRIFLQEGRKVLKVVFLLEIWREGELSIFSRDEDFLQRRGVVSKSRLCIKFRGKGRRRTFFLNQ